MDPSFYARYYELEDRHWWFIGRREIFLRILDSHLDPGDGSRRILDVGCGTGSMLRHLARYGRAEGVDADPEAIRFCRQRGLKEVERLDGDRLPFDSGVFDLVTALDVLEHIDDDRAMLAELQRVLKPEAHALVSVPAYRFLWGPQDEISHHKRRYIARELGDRASAAGFSVRRLSYFNTLLFLPIAAVRLLRPYRPGSGELKSDFELTSPSGALNSVLARLFAAEVRLLERFDLPFGVSILALLAKEPHPA